MTIKKEGISTENWTRDNIIWLAGLFEGEGCVTMGKHSYGYQIQLVIQSTDFDVIEKVHNIAGCGNINYIKFVSKMKKPAYKWQVSKQEYVYALIVALFSFMGNRRKSRMKEAIIYFNSKPWLGQKARMKYHNPSIFKKNVMET